MNKDNKKNLHCSSKISLRKSLQKTIYQRGYPTDKDAYFENVQKLLLIEGANKATIMHDYESTRILMGITF